MKYALPICYALASFAVSGWRGALGAAVVVGVIASSLHSEKEVDRMTAFYLDAVYFLVAITPFVLL